MESKSEDFEVGQFREGASRDCDSAPLARGNAVMIEAVLRAFIAEDYHEGRREAGRFALAALEEMVRHERSVDPNAKATGACECPTRKLVALAIRYIDPRQDPTRESSEEILRMLRAAAPCPCAGMPAAPNELVERQVDRRDAISLKRSTSSHQTKADGLGLAGGGTDGQQRSPEQREIPSGSGQDCERQPGQTTAPPIAQRLWDLVRHQRGDLHAAELITDAEYAELAADHGAVARLEAYDELRAQLATAEAEHAKLLEYARTVKGSRDVHSVYEVLDLVPKLRVELEHLKREFSRVDAIAFPEGENGAKR